MIPAPHRAFVPILISYIIIASLYALLIPQWEAPDEPAHFNYIRQLAEWEMPVMTAEDYDQAYQSEVISQDFDPIYSVQESFSYEDYQPPLYYLVQTPIYWLFGGSPAAMRLIGVLLGAITLVLTWLIFNAMASILKWPLSIPLLAIGFFAFLPQHIAMQASINNDSLAELIIAGGLLALIYQAKAWHKDSHSSNSKWWLIAFMSMAVLTKVTAYMLILVVGLTILWVFWGQWQKIVQKGFELFTIPFLGGCIWWGRNLWVYGWPDFLGIQRHDEVVVGQPTTAEWIDQFGFVETGRRFLQTTFRSFWGQFGWMEVVMPSWVYTVLAIFSIAVFVGFLLTIRNQILDFRRQTFPSTVTSLPSTLYSVISSLFILNLALYLAYNLTYVQHQGRYFFSALVPISLAVAIGVWFFIGQNKRLNNLPWGYLLSAGLIGLNLLALFRYILPAL
ncbi:MAG: phospholipid carrier-dependent glycosyltransferase [Chloroflexota bacterium]